MIVTIEGREGEGKSLLANKICGDLKRVDIPVRFFYGHLSFQSVELDTQVIVVDDIKTGDFDRVYYSFRPEYLWLDKQGKDPVRIKMPDVILIKR